MLRPALWWSECTLCVFLERWSRAFLESPWRERGPSQSSEPLACTTLGPPLLWHPWAFQSLQSVLSSFLLSSIPQGSPPSLPPRGSRCVVPPAHGGVCVLGGSSPPTPELPSHSPSPPFMSFLPALLTASTGRQSSPVTLYLNCRVVAD